MSARALSASLNANNKCAAGLLLIDLLMVAIHYESDDANPPARATRFCVCRQTDLSAARMVLEYLALDDMKLGCRAQANRQCVAGGRAMYPHKRERQGTLR